MKIEKFEIIDRCLYYKEKGLLIVGDLHLGYEENLNNHGISIPKNQINETIELFERIFEKCELLKEIVLLGDIKHYFSKILKQELEDLDEILGIMNKKMGAGGRIIIIKGNHDKLLSYLIKKYKNVELVDEYVLEEIMFRHGDFLDFNNKKQIKEENKIEILVIGHYHPSIILSDGVKQEKYKCFLYGKSKEIKKKLIIVPSFFPLIEGSDILTEINWKIDISEFKIIILDEKGNLYKFGKVKKLKEMGSPK